MNKRNENLAEALECCREGDLDRLEEFPELQELATAVETDQEVAAQLAGVQANDAILAGALREAPCPEGLAERIAASIAMVESAVSPSESISVAADETVQPVQPPSQPLRRRRAWGVIGAVAALLLIAAVPVFWPTRTPGRAELIARTSDWRKAAAGADWRTADPPKSRPWSQKLAFAPEEVAVVSTADDRKTTVYRYARPLRNGRGSVYLFVVRTASASLPSAPPARPDFDSGGIRVGLWNENGMVYALVVVGNADAYQRMVGRPSRSA